MKKVAKKKNTAKHISEVIKDREPLELKSPKRQREPTIKKGTKIDKKPSVRHLVVFKEISGNISKEGKPKSIKQAMKDAGYSDSYAESSTHMVRTKGFKALLDKYIPEELVTKTHLELMKSKTIAKFDFPIRFTDEQILEVMNEFGFQLVQIITNNTGIPEFRSRKAYYIAPNDKARKEAIDMAYKLRGSYEPEKHSHKFDGLSKEELVEIITRGISGKS